MKLTSIMIRWYRSFNTLSMLSEGSDPFALASWNKIGDESFSFVSLSIDSKISTIVGANEAGKSHILTAISKAFNGYAPPLNGKPMLYSKQDICRYCEFDHLEKELWPQFVVELIGDTNSDKTFFRAISESDQSDNRIWVLIDGKDSDSYAKVYIDFKNNPVKQLTKSEWEKVVESNLPEVKFIAADKALANVVHVNQLLNLYQNKQPCSAYDPMGLQNLADTFNALNITTGKQVGEASLASYEEARSKLSALEIGPREHGQLEVLLFRDVLEVPMSRIEEIKSLASSEQPCTYQLISNIQERIDERVDLSRVWQQDSDMRLIVEFEAGLFFFRITDKTGIKYTFDERSSGLKYFISYYIQALALEKASQDRGLIVLMDEPDGFLSATGQRNLLKVFENLVDARRTKTKTQLIYTTHSPFLINKNYPQRVRLVRKGDGTEGSQIVDRLAYRRFEPIRTALGIDFADTLFVGTQNIVVEGPSDQRLLTSCIQELGKNLEIDTLLDLNQTVFLSAGGTPRMQQIIARSLGGTDDKLPVVIALFDGDEAGSIAYQEIFATKLLPKEHMVLLDQIGIKQPIVNVPNVLEDLIPTDYLVKSVVHYYRKRWNKDADIAKIKSILNDPDSGDNHAERLKKIWLGDSEIIKNVPRQDDFRAFIIEAFCEILCQLDASTSDYLLLIENIKKVCSALSMALLRASADQARQVSKKRILYFVREFRRSYQVTATKAVIEKYLSLLLGECSGAHIELKKARENLTDLQEKLNKEVSEADALINRNAWVKALERFANCPWH